MSIRNNKEKVKARCPICGSELCGTEYSEYSWGTVESHVHCQKCTYREEMCYSKPFEFICETDTEQNKKKAKRLEIRIIPEKEYEQI